jgi:molybdopterin adenylyltransferase
MGKVFSLNISEKKGTTKKPVASATLTEGHGFEGDAHSGTWHRQVSLLDVESIKLMQDRGLEVNCGDFAENITTQGISLDKLKIGDILKVGEGIIEVTQIGKKCHDMCEVKKKIGECIMPRKGIFCKVLKGCKLSVGDDIRILPEIRIGILTISDKGSRGEREDKSSETIKNMVREINGVVKKYSVVPDEIEVIKNSLKEWCEQSEEIDIVFTTGGTGFSKRDVTPEATQQIIQKHVPGLSELMRREGCKHNSKAALSRGISGIRNNTLVVNLPGSVKGVKDSLEAILDILPHGIEILRGEASECGDG